VDMHEYLTPQLELELLQLGVVQPSKCPEGLESSHATG
jgi:hypothetical protein